MIKIKITRRWKNLIGSRNSFALTCVGTLWCIDAHWSEGVPSWWGEARIYNFTRRGGIRRSETRAREDAEKLAVDLLRDIRDGTKEFMDKCGMGEDD